MTNANDAYARSYGRETQPGDCEWYDDETADEWYEDVEGWGDLDDQTLADDVEYTMRDDAADDARATAESEQPDQLTNDCSQRAVAEMLARFVDRGDD